MSVRNITSRKCPIIPWDVIFVESRKCPIVTALVTRPLHGTSMRDPGYEAMTSYHDVTSGLVGLKLWRHFWFVTSLPVWPRGEWGPDPTAFRKFPWTTLRMHNNHNAHARQLSENSRQLSERFRKFPTAFRKFSAGDWGEVRNDREGNGAS